MPKLGVTTATTRLYLPSTKDAAEADRAYVDVRNDVEAGKIAQLDTEDKLYGVNLILLYVAAWNFTEDDGTATPVTVDNLLRLAKTDFALLDRYVGDLITKSAEGVSASLKELSSPTSAQSTTGSPAQ